MVNHNMQSTHALYQTFFFTDQPIEQVKDEEMGFSPETYQWVDALVDEPPPPNIVYDIVRNVNSPPPFWQQMFSSLSAQTPRSNNQPDESKVIATSNLAR